MPLSSDHMRHVNSIFISRLRSEKVRSDQEVNDPFEEPDSTRVRVRLIRFNGPVRFSFDNTY
jgi:hypothetical protein